MRRFDLCQFYIRQLSDIRLSGQALASLVSLVSEHYLGEILIGAHLSDAFSGSAAGSKINKR